MDEKELFSQEFIENTYLYFYKRLANHQDAEDLANDVILEALRAIRKKKEIRNFYAWYWQMAHNMYAKFLDMKKYHAVSLDEYTSLGGTGMMLSDSVLLEDALISEEETRTLNYSISKLSKLQREIVILYYLKQYKISQISDMLDIPESTVKTRLKDAKINIKKGMETMQITGLSSYAPIHLNLWGGGQITKHWDNIRDLISKQIFCVCSKKAHTIKEISDEIGVAPVYFEDKMRYLIENKFLKETSNGKYLTDFCLYPEQLMQDFSHEKGEIMEKVSEELIEAILSVKDEVTALDFYGNHFDYNYLMWILCVFGGRYFVTEASRLYAQKWESQLTEKYEKDYSLSGSYTYPDEKIKYYPCKEEMWSNMHWYFKTQNYHSVAYANLFETDLFGVREPGTFYAKRDSYINEKNVHLLMNIIDNPKYELIRNDEETAANLISVGYLKKEDNGIYPTFPVMSYYIYIEIEKIIEKAVIPVAEKYYDVIGKLGEKMFLPETREDLFNQFASDTMGNVFNPITSLFYYARITNPVLAIPEDYDKSAAGIVLYYSK